MKEAGYEVLILVLVEEPIGVSTQPTSIHSVLCLNPCFSGRTNRSALIWTWNVLKERVLILVLVEEPIGDLKEQVERKFGHPS